MQSQRLMQAPRGVKSRSVITYAGIGINLDHERSDDRAPRTAGHVCHTMHDTDVQHTRADDSLASPAPPDLALTTPETSGSDPEGH